MYVLANAHSHTVLLDVDQFISSRIPAQQLLVQFLAIDEPVKHRAYASSGRTATSLTLSFIAYQMHSTVPDCQQPSRRDGEDILRTERSRWS